MTIRINQSRQSNSVDRDLISGSDKTDLDFKQSLTQVQKVQHQELQEFLQRLDQQGAQLSQTFSLKDLTAFKELVRSFLRSTFGQSRNMQEESYWDFRGQPKILARITKIDHALEDLGKQALAGQTKQLDLLNKIDEIRGLILDLFA